MPSSIRWYFNDVLISFTSNVSTNTFGGETGISSTSPQGGHYELFTALQIVKNLVKASSGASCSVKGGGYGDRGQRVPDEVQFVYSIPYHTKGVGNQNVVTIVSEMTSHFAIREKRGSVVLTAMARLGASEITSGLTYRSGQMVNGAWQTPRRPGPARV